MSGIHCEIMLQRKKMKVVDLIMFMLDPAHLQSQGKLCCCACAGAMQRHYIVFLWVVGAMGHVNVDSCPISTNQLAVLLTEW